MGPFFSPARGVPSTGGPPAAIASVSIPPDKYRRLGGPTDCPPGFLYFPHSARSPNSANSVTRLHSFLHHPARDDPRHPGNVRLVGPQPTEQSIKSLAALKILWNGFGDAPFAANESYRTFCRPIIPPDLWGTSIRSRQAKRSNQALPADGSGIPIRSDRLARGENKCLCLVILAWIDCLYFDSITERQGKFLRARNRDGGKQDRFPWNLSGEIDRATIHPRVQYSVHKSFLPRKHSGSVLPVALGLLET